MTLQPPPRPPRPPKVPRPKRVRPARPGPAPLPPWGWLEWLIVAQAVLIPGLLFIPGMSALRTVSRVASYGVGLAAWAYYLGRRPPQGLAGSDFPARPWLVFCVVWLGLSVFHPNANSPLAAAAQVGLYLAIFAPAFWATSAVSSSRQIPRMMAILFLCNALSAMLGVAQVLRPGTFDPPYIPMADNPFFDGLKIKGLDGRMILRPCGLTDTPGGACTAGMVTALIGLCWALRPIAFWKRAASLVLAFFGVAVIYYSYVRSSLVMLAVCLVALTGLLAVQKNFRQAGLLASAAGALFLGALAWVVGTAGSGVRDRFLTLFAGNPLKTYGENRGGFVRHAFEHILPNYPFGYGMGWWGMINQYFGRQDAALQVWVEVMWSAWLYDGGALLMVGYVGAIAAAMVNSVRIALTCGDREIAYWAAVVVASNLGILATCFSYVTFLAPVGLQFWLQSAALHAADRRTRPPRKAPA